MAIAYFLLNLASRLPNAAWLLCLLAFAPLLPFNSLARNYNRQSGLDYARNDRFTGWNWLGIVLGGIFVLLVIWGTLLLDK